MARIFLSLALFAIALLGANIVLGLSMGDYNGQARQFLQASRDLNELKRKPGTSPQEMEQARHRLQAAEAALAPIRSRATLHMLLGMAAALTTVLVNCITVTYFIGTSRWCREVVDTYGLDENLALASRALKRRTFPWAVAGMLIILLIVGLGGASDPGGNAANSQNFVTLHYVAAVMGTLLIAWSYWVQVGTIGANYQTIAAILLQVEQVQQARRKKEPVQAGDLGS